jgi:uncharacterized protein
MKLQPDLIASNNLIRSYTSTVVQVAEHAWQESLLLPWQGDVTPWNAPRFEALGPAHFDQLAALSPEIVLFGSGNRLRFPRPQWLGALMQQRIGLETMDTAAACRTYNLLLAEGRKVVAALLIEAN